MKKTKTMLMMIMVVTIVMTGCGKETKVETREIMTEKIQVEETETERYISEEYLEELDYNSETNVYPKDDDDYEYETLDFEMEDCKFEYTWAKKDGITKEVMVRMILTDEVFEDYENFKSDFEYGFEKTSGVDACDYTWAEETSFGFNVVTCYITDIEY